MKQEGVRGFWSMFPLTRVPFWYWFFELQPFCGKHHLFSGFPTNGRPMYHGPFDQPSCLKMRDLWLLASFWLPFEKTKASPRIYHELLDQPPYLYFTWRPHLSGVPRAPFPVRRQLEQLHREIRELSAGELQNRLEVQWGPWVSHCFAHVVLVILVIVVAESRRKLMGMGRYGSK